MSRAGLLGLVMLVAVGAFGVLAPAPRVDNRPTAWLPEARVDVQAYRQFQSTFGTDEIYVVSLSGGPILPLLRVARAVEDRLDRSPTVEQILGPTRLFDDEVELLLDPVLGGPEAVARLSERFGSPVNRALGVIATKPPEVRIFAFGRVSAPAQREALAQWFTQRRASLAASGITLRVAGGPALNLELDRAGERVRTVAMPILVFTCVLILLVVTRSPQRTVAALIPVGLAVLASEGALGHSGRSGNLVVEVVKPLLFVLLLASALHVIVGWEDARRGGADRRAAPWRGAGDKARAVLLALLTTAVGFGSLAFAGLDPISTFGGLAAVGLVIGAPLVLVGLPALLELIGGDAPPPRRLGDGAAWLADLGHRHRVPAVGIGLAIIAAGAFAWPRLVTDPHAIHYLAEHHPLRVDHEAIEAAGLGLATLEVVVRADRGLLGPGDLDRLDRFAREAEALPGIRRILGPPLLLREANTRAGGPDALPEGSVLAAISREARNLDGFVANDGKAVRFSALVGTVDAHTLDDLADTLTARLRALDPTLTINVTGNYRLLLEAQATLLDTLSRSLLISAGLIALIMLVVVRTPRLLLAAVVPNAIPVAGTFALMAALGVPLDVGTCMTAAVALGIAVDDTLHVLVAWQKHRDVGRVARSAGRAILLSSMVIGAGFAVLLTADFRPTQNFGLLCAAAMFTAILADLVVLPALLPDPSSRTDS